MKRLILSTSLFLIQQIAIADCSVPNGFSTGSGTETTTIWFSPSGKFAYVLLGRTNQIVVYTYDVVTGKLTKVPNAETSTYGVTPTFGGGIHPNGKFMYITNKDSSTISVFAINPINGRLTSLQTIKSPFFYPYVLTISPDEQYAYVTVIQSDKLLLFRINQEDGTLSTLKTSQHPLGYIETKNQPFVLSFSPSKKYAYLASYGQNSIVRYSYESQSGDLTLDKSWELNHNLEQPYAILFDPSGEHAYIPANLRNEIQQFVNKDDNFKPSVPMSVSTGATPNTFIPFYYNSSFAYMGNYDDSSISIYKVNDGVLSTLLTTYTITQPIVLRQPPDSTHMFVVSRVENCIADYNVNKETGALTPRYVNTDITVNHMQ